MQKQILKAKTVGTKLTPKEYSEIEGLVDNGSYLGVSDFVRESIREKLETLKVIKTKNITYKQAKKEVLSYFREIQEAYPSDAANDLEIDLELVYQIIAELRKEGRLGDIA